MRVRRGREELLWAARWHKAHNLQVATGEVPERKDHHSENRANRQRGEILALSRGERHDEREEECSHRFRHEHPSQTYDAVKHGRGLPGRHGRSRFEERLVSVASGKTTLQSERHLATG